MGSQCVKKTPENQIQAQFCNFNFCFWSMNIILDPLDPHAATVDEGPSIWITLRHQSESVLLVTGASNPRGSEFFSERVESAGFRCSSAWPPSASWLDVSPGFCCFFRSLVKVGTQTTAISASWQLFWPSQVKWGLANQWTTLQPTYPQPYTNHRPSPSMSGCWFYVYMGGFVFVHLFFGGLFWVENPLPGGGQIVTSRMTWTSEAYSQ